MRVRASYTVENSVIIPVFVIIMVSLMTFVCKFHDRIVTDNINSQMMIEGQIMDMDEASKEVLRQKAQLYINSKTIFDNNVEATYSDKYIKDNNSKTLIRITCAVMEVVK